MKAISLSAIAAAILLTSSCNTMIGIGRDMRIAGEGLEKASNKVSGGGNHDTSGAPVY